LARRSFHDRLSPGFPFSYNHWNLKTPPPRTHFAIQALSSTSCHYKEFVDRGKIAEWSGVQVPYSWFKDYGVKGEIHHPLINWFVDILPKRAN
jgi:hypothetical protein